MLKTLQGRASAWLLARPSHHKINHASLATAFALCLALLGATVVISFAQWILSERLQIVRIDREQRLSLHADTSLKMSMAISNAHRATLSALLARDDSEFEESVERRQTALDTYDSTLDSAVAALNPEILKQKQATSELARTYRSLSAQLLEMVKNGDLTQALDFRLLHLRPAFDQWLGAHDKFANRQTHEILEKDTTQLQTIRILRRVLFALVLAPAILLVLTALLLFATLGLGYLTRQPTHASDPWSH